jgi:hypothetical protein
LPPPCQRRRAAKPAISAIPAAPRVSPALAWAPALWRARQSADAIVDNLERATRRNIAPHPVVRPRVRRLLPGGCMVISVKVFSATKAYDRANLGDVVTSWLRDNPAVHVVDKIVTQSSDMRFHCLTITLLYETRAS